MFSARKKAKRIVRDTNEDQNVEEEDNGPVVKRPGVAKTKSKLRISFQPDDTEEIPTNDTKRFGGAPQSLPRFNVDRQDERPTYSRSALDELRNSTPSTPQELTLATDNGVDVAAKFGIKHSISIPSASEIREKKERRARLAKEKGGSEDFIPLDGYDSDGEFKPQRMQVGSYFGSAEEAKDTRLVRDDEDFAEGFDEFVEDSGRVTMGRKAMLEQSRKDRDAMREMIEQAEGSEDESDSDAERNHAYETAQTQHGMDGLSLNHKQKREAGRPQQPRETTPIPKLAAALNRLKEAVQQIEMEKIKIEKRRAEVKKERAEIKANQQHIQQSLEEAGKELEKLQSSGEKPNGSSSNSISERGLENIGTPVPSSS